MIFLSFLRRRWRPTAASSLRGPISRSLHVICGAGHLPVAGFLADRLGHRVLGVNGSSSEEGS